MPDETTETMKARLEYREMAPGAIQGMLGLVNYVRDSGLDHALVELIEIRASQINGCAHCLDMHSRNAREAGESEERLYALAAWQESPLFSPRERAALAWTEAVTLVAETRVPDEVYATALQHFSEQELVDLTIAVVAINGWNRLAVAFRRVPGS